MKKTDKISIRIDNETKQYLDNALQLHHCNLTEFVTKQILREEYYEVKMDEVKQLIYLMGNIANNMNQIAHALNILKKKDDKMRDDEFQELSDRLTSIEMLFGKHDEELQKKLLMLYHVSKSKKKRKMINSQNEDTPERSE